MIGNRYRRDTGMVIQYVPKDVLQRARELNEVAEKLLAGLEYITLADGSKLRGTGCKSRVEDGVLHFFVNYNMFVYKQEKPCETMEKVEVEGAMG